MASERLYYSDAYLRTFDSEVVELRDDGIILTRTAFYPRGGGQPPDRGTMESSAGISWVVDVSGSGPEIVHRVEGTRHAAGERVRCALDWDLRYRYMRLHTALHALSAVILRDWGADVTGSNIADGGEKARMDFSLEGIRISDILEEVEGKVNAEVARSLPVKTYELPREEALAIPDLIRTHINLLPEQIERVRIVEIEGLDLQADGGTHVSNTREVEGIKVLGGSNKGKINRRIEIALRGLGAQGDADV